MSDGRDGLIGRQILGRYRIVRQLARGGMGVIYLARSEGAAGFVKPVVIKRILPDLTEDQDTIRLFVREAHILASLQHPNIVNVIDFAEEDGAYVMVLEYVHGYNLGKWYRYIRDTRGAFPAELGIHILIRVLDALHYAHTLTRPDGTESSVIHRDVSPSNVLIDVAGNIKLADFGVARMSNQQAHYDTRKPSLKGKLPYLAPELYRGESPSPQTDVYAAGVVLHEILLGTNFFQRREVSQTMHRVLHEVPSQLRDHRADLPEDLDDVLAQAMEKTPQHRFPDAASFAQALRNIRTRADEKVANELTERTRDDFYGGLAEHGNLVPLSDLDTAWREEQADDRASLEPEVPTSSMPPTVELNATSTRPISEDEDPGSDATEQDAAGTRAAPRRRRWQLWAALGAVVLGGAAAAAYAITGERDAQSARRFIVVDRDSPAEPDGNGDPDGRGGTALTDEVPFDNDASARASSDEDASAASGSSKDAGVNGEKERRSGQTPERKPAARKARPSGDLSRAFAKQQDQVGRCFRQHAEKVEGSPRVSIHFRIDETGTVQKAQVDPSRLDATPLGKCLLQVARSTRFGAQPKPVAFRIPITVKRR